MKKQYSQTRTNFIKKIFIKICRIFGYEIIDQSNFYVPTQEKKLDENFCLDTKLEVIEVGIPIFQLIPYVNYNRKSH